MSKAVEGFPSSSSSKNVQNQETSKLQSDITKLNGQCLVPIPRIVPTTRENFFSLFKAYDHVRNNNICNTNAMTIDSACGSGPIPGVACISPQDSVNYQMLLKNAIQNMPANNVILTPLIHNGLSGISENARHPVLDGSPSISITNTNTNGLNCKQRETPIPTVVIRPAAMPQGPVFVGLPRGSGSAFLPKGNGIEGYALPLDSCMQSMQSATSDKKCLIPAVVIKRTPLPQGFSPPLANNPTSPSPKDKRTDHCASPSDDSKTSSRTASPDNKPEDGQMTPSYADEHVVNSDHWYARKTESRTKTKSQIFLDKIKCKEKVEKYRPPKGKKKSDYCFRNRSDSADLPHSILTVREQRDFLKSSGEVFVQDAPCYEISKMYGVETSGPLFGSESWCKCRECRSARQKESPAVFCRFYGFRKLKFVDNNLCTSGFLLPEECTDSDLRLWLPVNHCCSAKSENKDDLGPPNHLFNEKMCRFILMRIANQFCEVVEQERRALMWFPEDETIYWKRPVSGVREMCDVCETTLFNIHWVCPKCGFGVCLDCYERRKEKTTAEQEFYDSERTNCFRWLRCNKGKNHFHSSLLPITIIPSSCLTDISEIVHQVKALFSIRTNECPCETHRKGTSRSSHSKKHFSCLAAAVSKIEMEKTKKALMKSFRKRSADETSSSSGGHHKVKERKINWPSELLGQGVSSNGTKICLHDIIAQRMSREEKRERRRKKKGLPPVMPDPRISAAPRNWLCDGKLLQLTDSSHEKNCEIFKVHWQYGMPILVSGVGKYLHMDLWHPDQISREYGDENSKNSLVNCSTGSIITNMKIRDFWDGFENISQRLLDENDKTMILKLKDWPPTQAFHEVMPEMFEDLMNALPLPEYTYIAGKCNLASRLPHFFVKPDLGPKMYNAYGWVTETDWHQGTTNLHLDISDAVNLMVYVGIPLDEPPEAKDRLLQIIEEGEVDEIQYRRALTDKPGALWHIFHERDTDKIRNFIKKVCSERGEVLSPGHDPIHDQQMYLDKQLRHRLKMEYDVQGFSILQCQGDGVFIPAGAPHQVFNLHSCVKIAEDFVSPEHVGHCFVLTNEFRYLSSTHSNHEDKLQIKNIIYHSIKDIVSSVIHSNCVG